MPWSRSGESERGRSDEVVESRGVLLGSGALDSWGSERAFPYERERACGERAVRLDSLEVSAVAMDAFAMLARLYARAVDDDHELV